MLNDQLKIRTASDTWVIPHDCRLLEALLASRGLSASDLRFSSELECRDFIQRLALLATRDQLSGDDVSSVSQLLRELMARQYGNGAATFNPAVVADGVVSPTSTALI
jgi:hypothetical protein